MFGCSSSLLPFVLSITLQLGDPDTDVQRVLSALDDRTLSVDEQLEFYRPDAVILVPGEHEVRGYAALRSHLSAFGEGATVVTRHEVVELQRFSDVVVVQGRVVGTAQPDGDPQIYPFETKNLILMTPDQRGELKIWKVIYNMAPTVQP